MTYEIDRAEFDFDRDFGPQEGDFDGYITCDDHCKHWYMGIHDEGCVLFSELDVKKMKQAERDIEYANGK